MISLDKKYTTCDGFEVSLWTTTAKSGKYTVQGEAKIDGGIWEITSWMANGAYWTHGGEHGMDLIEVKPQVELPSKHGDANPTSLEVSYTTNEIIDYLASEPWNDKR